MSKLLIPVAIICLGLAAWFWGGALLDPLADWAAAGQREFQNRIARSLRALRAGEGGALALLVSLCFAYGFFHAVGPGHGKVLLGGYGLGRELPWRRLSLIGLFSSLGQAVTAIVLVYGAVFLFDLTRQRMVGLAEDAMAPLSYGAIVLIGCWLVLRGLRRAWAVVRSAQGELHSDGHQVKHHDHHDHDRDHDHHDHRAHDHHPQVHQHEEASLAGAVCSDCGHRHGPSIEEASAVSNLREALVLIAGIAIRPCSGALFVLIITWQMGIAMAGIVGTFAMALGTATVTIAVALAASGLRGGLLLSLAGQGRGQRLIPALELTAGVLVVLVAGGLLMSSL